MTVGLLNIITYWLTHDSLTYYVCIYMYCNSILYSGRCIFGKHFLENNLIEILKSISSNLRYSLVCLWQVFQINWQIVAFFMCCKKIMDFWWHYAFCKEIVPINPLWEKTYQGAKNMVMEVSYFSFQKNSQNFSNIDLGAGHEQLKTKVKPFYWNWAWYYDIPHSWKVRH